MPPRKTKKPAQKTTGESMNIEEFKQQFTAFAKANGVTAEPTNTPHEATRIPGSVEQHYITYTHEDGRTYEVALNVAHTGGSGQKDAEMRGLREFFSLGGGLTQNWDSFTGQTKPFEPRAKGEPLPNKPDSEKRIGEQVAEGFYRDLGTGANNGQTHVQDGVTYRFVKATPFSGLWVTESK